MIKPLLACTIAALAVALPAVGADSSRALPDDASWRDNMRRLVKEGNAQYERSYRTGILLYADSLKAELTKRARQESAPTGLTEQDSMEFTADYLKLMGDYHYENSNYDESSLAVSEDYYRRALAIYDNSNFYSNLDLDCAPMIHRELAQLYYKQGRYTEARSEMAQAYDAFRAVDDLGGLDPVVAPELYLQYLDIRTYLALCDARVGADTGRAEEAIDEVLAVYAGGYAEEHGRDGQEKYYETLRKKAKIIMLAGAGSDRARNDALTYYKDYFAWRRDDALSSLATMTADERQDYWMRMRPFVADAYRTEDADPAFLYDITLFAKGLLLQIERLSGRGEASNEALASLRYTWRDVQRQLGERECAIEFVQYEKDGRQQMAALVLRNSGQPRWVAFAAPDDLLDYDCNGLTGRERLSTTNGYLKNDLYNDSTLCAMLWNADLLAAVKGCTRVFFAPDGYLHQLAIEYMLPDATATAQQPRLLRLTSTRRLISRANAKSRARQKAAGRARLESAPTAPALLMGGVRYDDDTADEPQADEAAVNDTVARSLMRSMNARFRYLAGTKKEIDSIYATRRCDGDTLLTGTAATEAAFRRLCPTYPVVSISTHGYFAAAEVPMGTDLKPCYTDESLSQSVIALAGCNASIAAGDSDDETAAGEYDGLLSASELSRCDMSRTKIAVISACQTGLGYITADGVYGLQRGLKNAGVESMIVSLWNVSDEATARLMTAFHRGLSHGMTTAEAFRAARNELAATRSVGADPATGTGGSTLRFNAARLINEVVSDGGTTTDYSLPQYTNAFILIDATE